jgi:hypothetical protein
MSTIRKNTPYKLKAKGSPCPGCPDEDRYVRVFHMWMDGETVSLQMRYQSSAEWKDFGKMSKRKLRRIAEIL